MYRLCASQSIMYYVLAPHRSYSRSFLRGPVIPATAGVLTDLETEPMCLRRCARARILPIRRAVRGEPTGKHRARCTNSEQYSDWLTILIVFQSSTSSSGENWGCLIPPSRDMRWWLARSQVWYSGLLKRLCRPWSVAMRPCVSYCSCVRYRPLAVGGRYHDGARSGLRAVRCCQSGCSGESSTLAG